MARTGHIGQQSYSHDLPYPPHQVVNIVPKYMEERPAFCEVIVQDSHDKELGNLRFQFYSPYNGNYEIIGFPLL